MVTRPLLRRRLRVMTIGRLLIGAFFLICAQFVFSAQAAVFYFLISVIVLLSFIDILWLQFGRGLKWLGVKQIACDLVLESILVYFTGGVDSPFAVIFILSILSSGFVISPISTFIIAFASSLLFSTCVLINSAALVLGEWLALNPAPIGAHESIYVFYAIYVRVTVFFLVAFLTYYFSGRIRQLETQMKTQEHLVLLGEVISTIAHEIRNPLASISGTVELLSKQAGPKLSRRHLKLMEAAVEEAQRVKGLFNNLLDYARVPQLNREHVSLEKFLEQVTILMKHQEDYDERVKILRVYEGKQINVNMDPEYMKQAVMNVMSNAYQAMPDGGELAVDCNQQADGVHISIQDTGKGMTRRELESLFIPFRTSKRKGTGLGMAQVHKVVTQHGGKIKVQSKLDKGTHVDFLLPAA